MTIVSSGQTYSITPGNTETGDVVSSGGTLIVDFGGTDSATTVVAGGSATVLGTEFGATSDRRRHQRQHRQRRPHRVFRRGRERGHDLRQRQNDCRFRRHHDFQHRYWRPQGASSIPGVETLSGGMASGTVLRTPANCREIRGRGLQHRCAKHGCLDQRRRAGGLRWWLGSGTTVSSGGEEVLSSGGTATRPHSQRRDKLRQGRRCCKRNDVDNGRVRSLFPWGYRPFRRWSGRPGQRRWNREIAGLRGHRGDSVEHCHLGTGTLSVSAGGVSRSAPSRAGQTASPGGGGLIISAGGMAIGRPSGAVARDHLRRHG